MSEGGNEWVHEWVHEWVGERMSKWVNVWVSERANKLMVSHWKNKMKNIEKIRNKNR